MNELEQIRKTITPQRIEEEVKAIRNEKFSPALVNFIERYKIHGKRKDLFVFEWCYRINQHWLVLDVYDQLKDSLRDAKTLLNMFVVQIDDISELKGKEDLLNELLKIPYNQPIDRDHLSKEDDDYLQLTIDIWSDAVSLIKKFPNYDKYKGCFDFDIAQLINAVRYGELITENKFTMNQTDYWQYFPYSMQIIINADLDLMCSINFDVHELGTFREVLLITQKMARIGNWLTTWQREVEADDYTSIVVPYCLDNGIIRWKDLENKDELIFKIADSDADDHFLNEWQRLYDTAVAKGKNLNSVNSEKIFDRFRYLLSMHLISRNLK